MNHTQCKLTVLLLLCCVGLYYPTQAQKACDLELSLINPSEGQTIPYGDTADLVYMIRNLGPDTLDLTDTLYLTIEGFPFTSIMYADLSPGDSVTYNVLSAWSDTKTDDTMTFCIYLLQERNETIIDSVSTNDTACVQFVLEGSDASGIADVIQAGQRQLQLIPNPANRVVDIDLVGIPAGKSAVTIRDISGREWLRRKIRIEGDPSGRKTTLNISKLPAGMYVVELQSASQRATGKLVVQ